jgi:hypothetical protein
MKSILLVSIIATLLLACGSKPSDTGPIAAAPAPVVQENVAPPETLATQFFKKFTGTIGDMSIVMDLIRDSDKLSGSYYYMKIGVPITLEGTINPDGTFELDEFGDGSITGKMSGTVVPNKGITGVWKNPKKGNTLSLSLTDVNQGYVQVIPENRESQNCKYASKELEGSEGGCTTLKVNFLKVGASTPQISAKINAHLLSKASELGFEKTFNSLDDVMKLTQIGSEEEGFNAELIYNLVTNDNNILCISSYANSYYFGAAHPNYGIHFANYDVRDGSLVQLEDLLLPGFEEDLNRIAEKAFIAKNGSEDWEFEQGNFMLNRNFAIKPGGLLFAFQPYEIGTYMAGAPDVYISYKAISKWIKRDGLLAAWVE